MSTRDYAMGIMKFAREVSEMLLQGYPDERATFQPSPTHNHALWVCGHIAGTDRWISGVMGGPDLGVPGEYEALFGMGSKPTPRPSDYPHYSEVLAVFRASREKLNAWLATAPDGVMSQQLGDKTGGFMNDGVDAMLKLAWHEGWHFGQVAEIRKVLGLPYALG